MFGFIIIILLLDSTGDLFTFDTFDFWDKSHYVAVLLFWNNSM